MSSKGERRIKGLRKFLDVNGEGVFNPLIPFGTDGKYVDIFSGLDLEEELILNGNKISTFSINTDQETQEKTTLIIEKYYEKTMDEIDTAIYSKCTSIKEIPIYDIIQGNSSDSVIGGTSASENIVIGNFLGKKNLVIKMVLYKGDYYSEEQQTALLEEAANIQDELQRQEEIQKLNFIFENCILLHTKTIEITYDPQSNEPTIIERLDYNQEDF